MLFFLIGLVVMLLLSITAAQAATITLAWNASSGPVAGYRVYYGQTSGNYTTVKPDAPSLISGTTYTTPDLPAGTYYLAVKAFDSAGNSSAYSNQVSRTIAVTTVAPTANFSANKTTGIASLAINFIDGSTGSISSHSWNFGDGTTSTAQNPSKTYSNAGTYTVKLTVIGPGGSNTVTKTNYITVTAPTTIAPVANFTASPTSGTAPLLATFNDTSTGSVTGWSWNFGDGTTSNVQNPTAHTYKTAGTYTVSLAVSGPGGTSTPKTMTVTAEPASTGSLLAPWLDKDIGSVGLAGSAGYANGTYTLKGAGADIYGTTDAFHFAYQPLNGDGSIVARVAGLTNTSGFAKAGVMIRENLDANARHALVALTPGNGVRFIRRTGTGGSSSATAGAAVSAPYWVKLTRAGTTFTAHQSANGSAWTQIGSAVTIGMGASVYVGLALTSNNNGALNTATLDNVSVTNQ